MRPDRFERLLADAINQDGRLSARTYVEAEFTRTRRGIIATTPGGTPINLQIAARSADGDNYAQPEGPPVTGAPHPLLDDAVLPNGAVLELAAVERYLAGLAVAAAPEEIAAVHLYQDREKPGAVRYGATFTFHSGAAIFLYVLSAGSSRHTDYVPRATVSA